MQGDAFRDWATGPGGLNEAAARAFLADLKALERLLGVDIAADWEASRLQGTAARIAATHGLDSTTRATYRSALKKYEEFRQLSGA
jgi:hypothetical protein